MGPHQRVDDAQDARLFHVDHGTGSATGKTLYSVRSFSLLNTLSKDSWYIASALLASCTAYGEFGATIRRSYCFSLVCCVEPPYVSGRLKSSSIAPNLVWYKLHQIYASLDKVCDIEGLIYQPSA